MSMTYHHYGVVLIELPLDRLWSDLRDSLIAPESILSYLGPIDVALPGLSSPTFQIAIRWDDTATVEAVVDRASGTHTLAYRTSGSAPGIAEYVATCTLQAVADEPRKTVVEWTRAYRPAAHADRDRWSAFVAKLRDRDQLIAAKLAAADDGAEVLLIDYALGGAALERRANRDTRHAQAA